MKFIKNLLGQTDDKPKWDIKPQDERPAPRRRAEAVVECAAPPKKEKNPFLDDDFEDMEIINETAPAKVDPYASNTWKIDQDADTRKLKTLHLTSSREEDNDEDFNPYDTGVFRRGWKD